MLGYTEGSGHLLLPVISFIALLTLDWRIALASLVTVPLSMVFMTLTMIISGKNFTQYDESNAHMNSTIVEYIEGIEVIKAFGREEPLTRSMQKQSWIIRNLL